MEALNRFLARRLFISMTAVGALFVLSGCSITGLDSILRPPSESEPQAQVKPKDATGSEADQAEPRAAAPTPLASPVRLSSYISGFRSSTVILYFTAAGSDGVRLSATSVPIPLAILGYSADGRRLQISTVEGRRWIAASDVIFGDPAATPGQ